MSELCWWSADFSLILHRNRRRHYLDGLSTTKLPIEFNQVGDMEEDDQNIPAREIFVLVKTKERVEDKTRFRQ